MNGTWSWLGDFGHLLDPQNPSVRSWKGHDGTGYPVAPLLAVGFLTQHLSWKETKKSHHKARLT